MNDKLLSPNEKGTPPLEEEGHRSLLYDDLVPLHCHEWLPVTKINNMPRLEMRVCSRRI